MESKYYENNAFTRGGQPPPALNVPSDAGTRPSELEKLDPDEHTKIAARTRNRGRRASVSAHGGYVADPSAKGRSGAELWKLLRFEMKTLTFMAVVVPDLPENILKKRLEHDGYTGSTRFIVHPESTFQARWDKLQVLLLLYVAIVVPYRTAFLREMPVDDPWFWFEVFVDVYFIVDMGINFRTGYYADEGTVLIQTPRKLAFNYLRKWFFVDLVACLPVTYIALLSEDGGETPSKLLKILRLMRLVKLLRLMRLQRLLMRYEMQALVQMFKMTGICSVILYTAHLLCCFWYFIGTIDDNLVSGAQSGVIQGWVGALESDWGGGNIGSVAGANDTNIGYRYLWSFYWAVTTLSTVGYGDITPNTSWELLFATFSELVGSIMFGAMAGTITSLITASKISEQKMESEMKELREFLAQKKIDKTIRQNVTDYMENRLMKRTVFDEKATLSKLPPFFQKQLLYEMYNWILLQVPLFSLLSEEIRGKLCLLLNSYPAVKGEVIYMQGEIGRQMYVVVHGKLQVLQNVDKEAELPPRAVGSLQDGDFFGESPFVSNNPLRDRTVTALTDCDLSMLFLDDIKRLTLQYPEIKGRLHDFSRRRKKTERKRLHAANKSGAPVEKYKTGALEVVHKTNTVEATSTKTRPKLTETLSTSRGEKSPPHRMSIQQPSLKELSLVEAMEASVPPAPVSLQVSSGNSSRELQTIIALLQETRTAQDAHVKKSEEQHKHIVSNIVALKRRVEEMELSTLNYGN